VGCRANGDIVGGDVDAYRLALEVDVREVLLCLSRVFMRNSWGATWNKWCYVDDLNELSDKAIEFFQKRSD
jgi:hypothetical protein